jgi:FkbM family methyltransferase
MFHINDKKSRNILVACDHGLLVVNRFDTNDKSVGHGQIILDHGNICTLEASSCLQAIANKSDPVIFDIGSNIGAFTTWLARARSDGKVYAFEPQRAVFYLLCANMTINNLHNVYCYNVALGENNSKIKFTEPNYDLPADFGTFSLVNDTINAKGESLIIDMYRLDSFVEIYQIDKIDLIKVDVEGMDLTVLKGARQSIEKYRPVIFVEYCNEYGSEYEQIKSFLDRYNYQYSFIERNILAIPN